MTCVKKVKLMRKLGKVKSSLPVLLLMLSLVAYSIVCSLLYIYICVFVYNVMYIYIYMIFSIYIYMYIYMYAEGFRPLPTAPLLAAAS